MKDRYKIPFIIVCIVAVIFIILFISTLLTNKKSTKKSPSTSTYICTKTEEENGVSATYRDEITYIKDGITKKIRSGSVTKFTSKKDYNQAKQELDKNKDLKYKELGNNQLYIYTDQKLKTSEKEAYWYKNEISKKEKDGYKCTTN